MIPIQRLKQVAQALVAIILLIPHILVIHDFLLIIDLLQRQANQAVDDLGRWHESGLVLLA